MKQEYSILLKDLEFTKTNWTLDKDFLALIDRAGRAPWFKFQQKSHSFDEWWPSEELLPSGYPPIGHQYWGEPLNAI